MPVAHRGRARLRAPLFAVVCALAAVVPGAAGGAENSGPHCSGPSTEPQVLTNHSLTIPLYCGGGEGDITSYEIATMPLHGSVRVDGDTVVYTPDRDYSGTDAVGFTAHDDADTVYPTATVTLRVTGDRAPVCAGSSSAVVLHGRSVSAPFSCVDPDGDPLTVSIVGPPTHGTAIVRASAVEGSAIVYTSSASSAGIETITVQAAEVNAPAVTSNPATVTVDVTNSAPTCAPVALSLTAGTRAGFRLACSDADGDPLTYGATAATHGTVVLDGPDAAYTPVPAFVGVDVILLLASDGVTTSSPVRAVISVVSRSTPPPGPNPGPVPPPSGGTTPPVTPRLTPPGAPTVITRSGVVPIRLACPPAMPTACRAVVRLTATIARRTVALGAGRLTLRAGRNGAVKISLAASSRRALRRFAGHTLRVTVAVQTRSSSGRSVTLRRVMTLRVPRR